MESPPEPFATFLDQINKALKVELYSLALSACLTIPDICAGLASDPKKHVHLNFDTFTQWFDSNAAHRFQNLTGADFYHLRGGVVHRGSFRHKNSRYDRVIFLLPGSFGVDRDIVVSFEENVGFSGVPMSEIAGSYPGRAATHAVLHVDLLSFCQIMLESAVKWISDNKEDPNIRENLPNLVRFRPEGLPPYIIGIPMVA